MEPPIETHVRHEYMKHSDEFWRVTFAAKVHLGRDWAAYVCASTEKTSETDAVDICLTRGNKLPESIARSIFEGIDEPYRR